MQQQAFLVKPAVSEYYGRVLTCTEDLKTSACCDSTSLPPRIAAALAKVHPDVTRKYYGCGLCLPPDDLSGLHVLDLGCGAGRDCFILSQLVGATGRVTGIDMTEEQLLVSAPAINAFFLTTTNNCFPVRLRVRTRSITRAPSATTAATSRSPKASLKTLRRLASLPTAWISS
jgi:SAM-dependent methyltransferase